MCRDALRRIQSTHGTHVVILLHVDSRSYVLQPTHGCAGGGGQPHVTHVHHVTADDRGMVMGSGAV